MRSFKCNLKASLLWRPQELLIECRYWKIIGNVVAFIQIWAQCNAHSGRRPLSTCPQREVRIDKTHSGDFNLQSIWFSRESAEFNSIFSKRIRSTKVSSPSTKTLGEIVNLNWHCKDHTVSFCLYINQGKDDAINTSAPGQVVLWVIAAVIHLALSTFKTAL